MQHDLRSRVVTPLSCVVAKRGGSRSCAAVELVGLVVAVGPALSLKGQDEAPVEATAG